MQRAIQSTGRNLFGLFLAAGLSTGLPTWAAAQEPIQIDRIVAVVNNTVITQHDLQSRVEATLRQLAQQNTPLPPRRPLERQILEHLVTEKALLSLAEESNLRMDANQLDRELTRIAQRNGMDLPSFRRALEGEGVDFASFREKIRAEFLIARLREREVDNRISVTDAEIDNYLANPAFAAKQQDEYQLAHIMVTTPEGASPEKLQELRAKAEKALSELQAGADFAQVSAAYSDAQNAMQGGALGWRTEAQIPSLFADSVKQMQAGEVSRLLRSPNGFHILKLIDKRGKDATLIIRQTQARHILIKTSEIVSDEDARNRLLQLKERVENKRNFAELAKLHSDDLSANKGGDLGWLNPGDTVPEFERAMDALKPGEVSEPVRSPFGWHLIQVVDRRNQDVTQERKRWDARQAIRQRKSEEAFENWVRQVRDSVYVEYRLED